MAKLFKKIAGDQLGVITHFSTPDYFGNRNPFTSYQIDHLFRIEAGRPLCDFSVKVIVVFLSFFKGSNAF
jgi:hypothetical protein